MKYIYLLIVTFGFQLNAQQSKQTEPKYLQTEDFIFTVNEVTALNKKISLRNYENKYIDVNFDLLSTIEEFKKADLKGISIMVSEIHNSILEKTKSDIKYSPKKILCYQTKEFNGWILTVFYNDDSSKNDKSSKFAVGTFNQNGELIKLDL